MEASHRHLEHHARDYDPRTLEWICHDAGAIRVGGCVSPAGCPVTQPNGNHPPNDHGPGGYGNDALWTNLYMWNDHESVARVPGDAFHVRPDGMITNLKWAWYRYIPGKLTIEGRRLDAPAPPLSADINAGYENIGFQPVALTIPSAG